jgi:hypothetical protein
VGVTRGSETDPVLGPPKIGGEVCWAGRAKSSDAKWAILEKKFGLGQTSSKFAEICSDGIPKSNFFSSPPGTGARKRPARAQIRSDSDRHGCQRGPNSFGCRQTLSKHRAKFVRTGQHTSPPIFGGPPVLQPGATVSWPSTPPSPGPHLALQWPTRFNRDYRKQTAIGLT